MHPIRDIITTFLIVITIRYLMTSAKKQPKVNSEGAMVLKMSKLIGIVGFMAVAFSVLPVMAIYSGVNSQEDLKAAILVFVIFFIGGGLFILISKNMRVEVDNEKITYYGIINGVKVIRWEDIIKVKYSKIMSELSLISRHEKIKIHMQFIGLDSFVELMKRKLDDSLYKEACVAYEEACASIRK